MNEPERSEEEEAALRAQVLEAQHETDRLIAAGRNPSDPTLPFFQLAATLRAETYRKQFEAGDRLALFTAIRDCANYGIVMAPWISVAFIRGYDQVLTFQAGSWDAVFGKPYPGKQIGALRKRDHFATKIYWDVISLVQAGAVIDDTLFEAVGSLYGIKKSKASEWFYELEKRIGAVEMRRKMDIVPSVESLDARMRELLPQIKMKKNLASSSSRKKQKVVELHRRK